MSELDQGALGRRRYDVDHDLLVRIDERLLTVQGLLQNLVGRVAALESWRQEQDGEKRANARTIAAIVAVSSGLTALAVKFADKLLT